MAIDWSAPVSWEECCRRAAARRNWNERRQAAAGQRRDLVQEAWLRSGGSWGWQSKLARELQVHKSTICRDVAMIKAALGLP